MCRLVSIALLLAAMAASAYAGAYYVATDGKPENGGTREKPWPSVEFALQKVGGGNTILLRPGVYRDPIRIKHAYAGTARHPTVIGSEVKWKAVIIGSPGDNISNDDNTDWLTIDGFESLGARSHGVHLYGSHLTVRNCWLHHNAWVGVGMGHHDLLIENNLIEFNGCHVQFAHGVYADGDSLTIRGNVVRHNAGFGLHLYDCLTNSLLVNNLVYGQIQLPGVIVACPQGGGHNRILNNTFVGGALALWNPGDDLVANNILVATGDPISLSGAKRLRADYNLCWPKSQYDGPHGISADPAFVDPSRGVYWLSKGSPAIGKGSREYAPPTDFWGRPTPKDKPPDLGAFVYVPRLLEPQARAGWYYGWAYGYAPIPNWEMPDLWVLPKTSLGEGSKAGAPP
jgi:parallel beta-helix repeat protein